MVRRSHRSEVSTFAGVAVMVAAVSCCRSHRSEVSTFADGRTVRRLGDGVGWVFLLCVRVCFVIGRRCQLLPVLVAVALVMVAAGCGCSVRLSVCLGRWLLCVPGALLSSVAIVSCCR